MAANGKKDAHPRRQGEGLLEVGEGVAALWGDSRGSPLATHQESARQVLSVSINAVGPATRGQDAAGRRVEQRGGDHVALRDGQARNGP